MKVKALEIVRGSGNVFADLGYANAGFTFTLTSTC